MLFVGSLFCGVVLDVRCSLAEEERAGCFTLCCGCLCSVSLDLDLEIRRLSWKTWKVHMTQAAGAHRLG